MNLWYSLKRIVIFGQNILNAIDRIWKAKMIAGMMCHTDSISLSAIQYITQILFRKILLLTWVMRETFSRVYDVNVIIEWTNVSLWEQKLLYSYIIWNLVGRPDLKKFIIFYWAWESAGSLINFRMIETNMRMCETNNLV